MKYVIVERLGMEVAEVFPDMIEHKHAVDLKETKVLSAGFCRVVENPAEAGPRVRAWGQSTSLGICSRKEDDQVIEFSLMNMGILPWRTAKV